MIASQALRLQKIRTIACWLTALSLLVVLLSAWLRLAAVGLGCADWPACYAQLLSSEPPAQAFGPLRLLHRATASLALLLVCHLAWLCWRRPSLPSPARPASALVLLVLALAVLGFWSSDPRLVLVSFLNILGGLGLVSFSWRVALASRPEAMLGRAVKARPGPPRRLLQLGSAALSLTLILGALIGARYEALACLSLPDCMGHWWPTADGWAAMQVFAALNGPPPAGEAGGISLHLLHRWSALLTLLLLGGAAWQALADGATRKAAMALLLLLPAQVMLGALTVISGFSLWLAVAHACCAAVLLATLVSLLRR
ncbi:MAG: COX15/CtaA family protein [Candidatus Accumulibacter phosphatis]